MSLGLSQGISDNAAELEKYIKQIKSYEEQVSIIEATAEEEERLRKKHPNGVLVLWTGIAGMQFHLNSRDEEDAYFLDCCIETGMELKLVREPDNIHDRWAIAVQTKDGKMLGYVTRYKNESVARLMDQGFEFKAFVEKNIQSNFEEVERQRARTENYMLPFSIWMIV